MDDSSERRERNARWEREEAERLAKLPPRPKPEDLPLTPLQVRIAAMRKQRQGGEREQR